MIRAIATILVCLGLAAAATPNECEAGTACKPWVLNGHACTRGGRMNLRFSVDSSYENRNSAASDYFNGTTYDHVTYAFCPIVDELQAFALNQSALWAASDFQNSYQYTGLNTPSFSQYTNRSYVRVYGMGEYGDPNQFAPTEFDSSAVLYENTTDCALPGQPVGPAIASFLVLNVTLTNGKYRHVNGFAQGVQVGFMPSCDENDKCMFGSGSVCIGKVSGKKNCAQCMAKPSDLATARVSVWTSYYGTDKNGRRLMSGSNNPVNFRQFATSDAYNSMSDSISGTISKL